MKTTSSLITALLIFTGFSCQNGSDRNSFVSEPAMEMEQDASFSFTEEKSADLAGSWETTATSQDAQTEDPAMPAERKIIKTVNYRIQVNDVNVSTEKVKQLVATHGGYISGMNLQNSSYEISNDITIRAPQDKLEMLLAAVGKEAIYTNYRSEQARDVTEEYVDLGIRLKTKKEVRDRYIDILRNKAKTVEDVLNAEEKIRVIQEEIESVEGRLKYLNNQISMSTINLTIYQRVEYQPQPDVYHESFASRVMNSLKGGWELLQGLVLFLIRIWPLLLLFGFFFWQRRRIAGWFRRKN